MDMASPRPCRMLLTHAKQPFENVTVDFPDIPELKAQGKLEFGQLPAFELPDGRFLSQTNSIIRYLGRTYGYYPEDDVHLAWQIDSLIDATEDFRTIYYKVHFE